MDSVKIMRQLLLETPPDPSCRDWRSFKETAKFLWKYRRVGNKLFRLVDLMTMSADDYLSEWFERTEIKAVLAYYSGIGTFAGPKSPGSAYVIMHHVMGEHAGAGGWGFVRGGMGAITQAIARSGKEKGLACKTECEVAGDRHGERPRRPASRSPTERATKRTSSPAMSRRSSPSSSSSTESKLPAEFVRDVETYRTFSTAFKINIACERAAAIHMPSTRGRAASLIPPTPISARRSNISSAPTTTPNTATCRASRS